MYLSTLVVRPGDKSRSATPKRAVGVLHLPLGDENRRLDLALETPTKMRPNQPLTVKIKASNKNGEMPKQVNVLVSAVDSGVLNITDYVTPIRGRRSLVRNAMVQTFTIFTVRSLKVRGVWQLCVLVAMVMS